MNLSTLNNPLAFFDHFYRDNGFSAYRSAFIYTDFEGADASYDDVHEIWSWEAIVSDDGEWGTLTKDFKEELFTKLVTEKEVAIKYIDLQIGSCKSKEDKQAALGIILNKLEFLSNKIDNYSEALKYGVNKNAIQEIIEYLTEIYTNLLPQNNFIKPSDEIIENSGLRLNVLQNNDKIKNSGVTTINILKSPDEFILKLYTQFELNGFIEKNYDFISFTKAFNGSTINEPLNIRWLKGVKGKNGKTILLFFIQELIDRKLIAPFRSNPDMLKRLGYIFIDKDFKPFKNLGVTQSSLKIRMLAETLTDQETELLTILDMIFGSNCHKKP